MPLDQMTSTRLGLLTNSVPHFSMHTSRLTSGFEMENNDDTSEEEIVT